MSKNSPAPSSSTYNSGIDTYTFTDGLGNQTVFDGFSDAWLPAQQGQFASMTSPGGTAVEVTSWTADGHIAEIQATADGITDSYLYAYVGSGVNEGLLASVTDRRSTDGGTDWQYVQGVSYTYYNGTDYSSSGNAGDLMTATILNPTGTYDDTTWTAISTDYYRYYTDPTASAPTPMETGCGTLSADRPTLNW